MVAGGMLPAFEDDDDEFETRAGKPAPPDHGGGGGGKRRLSSAATAPAASHQQQQQQQPHGIIYLMSVLSAMGGFLFGYDTGIVSGAMVFVRKVFNLNSLWQELVVSITILGAWILSLMAGSFSERYGRKTVILWASVIFTLGSVIMGAAWSKWILLFGRLTVGMAIGLASTVVPMYIAETAPTNIRGSLVTLNTCFITFGQMTAAVTAGAFSYDVENGWRWMLALAAVPATVQFLGFVFMPESPRWLIRRQRDDEALAALKRIRGYKNPNVLREFEKIRQNQLELLVQEERRKQQKRNIIVATIKKTATRRALTVGCLLMAAQQLAGINTVMYYTATIIEMSGVQSQSIAVWLAVPTAAVYVIFSFCGYLLADRLGRRTLTLGSLLGVILSLLLLGTGFQLTSMNGAIVTTHNMSTLEICYTKRDCASCIAEPRCGFCYDAQNLAISSCLERNPQDATKSVGGECAEGSTNTNFAFSYHICPSTSQGIGLNTWLVLTGLVFYLASFAPGMSSMPWTINSEIYPMWARSFCYSIATSVNWMFNLLITLTFISLTEVITTHGAFYMYSIIASTCWLLLFWKLPETRGKSLEDISSLFAKTKQLDDQEIMEDESQSANHSTIGGGAGGTSVAFSQFNLVNNQPVIGPTTVKQQQQQHEINQTAGHDNLAFASGDETSPAATGLHQRTRGVVLGPAPKPAPAPAAEATGPASLVERHRSFKLASPLSKAATGNLATSQPDLQADQSQHQQQQQQHQQQQQQHQQQPQQPPYY